MRKTVWVVVFLGAFSFAICQAQTESGPSRYVDHDTAVQMGGVGNYVSSNEVKLFDHRMTMENDLKDQLKNGEKSVSLPTDETVVFFNIGESQLTPQGKNEIHRIAEQVKGDSSSVVMVDGFTDNSQTERSDQQLAKQRADAVKNQLEDDGVSQAQIKTQSFGHMNALASNENQQGRAMNRRAEVFVERAGSAIG